MVPNQAEILQPLWISKRSQDGIVSVSWVCPNVLCKRCKISFLVSLDIKKLSQLLCKEQIYEAFNPLFHLISAHYHNQKFCRKMQEPTC